MFMQAMEDAGVSPSDEAVKRALVFLGRTQMDERVNDQPYAKGSRQGGFVYTTAENARRASRAPGRACRGNDGGDAERRHQGEPAAGGRMGV